MTNVETLKNQSSTNPSIEVKRIGRSIRASSTVMDKSSEEKNFGANCLRERGILLSSN